MRVKDFKIENVTYPAPSRLVVHIHLSVWFDEKTEEVKFNAGAVTYIVSGRGEKYTTMSRNGEYVKPDGEVPRVKALAKGSVIKERVRKVVTADMWRVAPNYMPSDSRVSLEIWCPYMDAKEGLRMLTDKMLQNLKRRALFANKMASTWKVVSKKLTKKG